MTKKLLFTFSTLALAAASAASYNVSFFQDATLDGKPIKAGDYKVQFKDNVATLKHNKQITEVPARTETAPNKFANTMVRYRDNSNVKEICIGGTNTKLVFEGAASTNAAGTK